MKRRWMKPVENGQTGNAPRKLSTRPAQEPQLRDVEAEAPGGQPFTHKELPRESQHPIAVFRYNKS
jgi:hypothetical protein